MFWLNVLTALAVILAALILVSTASAQGSGPDCRTAWTPYWDRDFYVPSLITEKTWMRRLPMWSRGMAVYYSPGLMRATAAYRGLDMQGYVGAVALQTPAHIGEAVWLKRPGTPWEGPFLVADTAARCHAFVNVAYLRVMLEVDFRTAVRWGMAERSYDRRGYRSLHAGIEDVQMSFVDPNLLLDRPTGARPMSFRNWWLGRADFVYTRLGAEYINDVIEK